MGGSCSLQRQRAMHWQEHQSNTNGRFGRRGSSNSIGDDSGSNNKHRSVRYSVVSQVPDKSIVALYPKDDNYVLDNESSSSMTTRSPKSLVELSTDAVCRSLPYLDGELPPGLPQDVVDDIVASLMKHSALNATTLRVFRQCELGSLSLAGCRGVTDEWLLPLTTTSSPSACSASTASMSPPPAMLQPYHLATGSEEAIEDMDLDDYNATRTTDFTADTTVTNPITGTEFREARAQEEESSSSSSCSFHSASSSPYDLPSQPISSSFPRDDMVEENDNLQMAEDENAYIPVPMANKTAPGTTDSTEGLAAAPAATTDNDSLPSSVPLLQDFMVHGPPCGGPPSDYFDHGHPNQSPSSPQSLTSNLTLLDLRGSQRLTDKGLLQLHDLGSLEVVKLDGCHSIVGRGLLAFAASHRLHTLSLANCRRLTDEAIINISHLSSLESLCLDGCRCITDQSLAAIGSTSNGSSLKDCESGTFDGLCHLSKLDLSQCDLLTDEGIQYLHNLRYIEELSLGWCRSITDVGIETLVKQPQRSGTLRVLRLARCSLTDVGINHLVKLKALEELDLNGCNNVTSTTLGNTLQHLENLVSLDVSYCPGIIRSSWQNKIKSLKSLELCYSGVKDQHLSRLYDLPALEEINLDSCPVGDWAISHLADNNVVPNLSSLDLADTDLSDRGMAHLPKFTKLTKLSLFYCNISNAGLSHLAIMTSLQALNLDSREIGDDGMSHLVKLTNLKSLDIFSGRVTDIGCAHISKIKSLESLELCGGGVGDLGCTLLATLDNLTSLNLSQNERITNRGAAALAALSNLKALNLSNTRVNASALRFFGGLVNLQSLALYGCRGVEDGSLPLDNLQNELPRLKCLRLNPQSDNDGRVNVHDDDSENDSDSEEEDALFSDEETNNIFQAVQRQQRQVAESDDEDDSVSIGSDALEDFADFNDAEEHHLA